MTFMKHFIFLTDEGRTLRPDRDLDDEFDLELENLQVLGVVSGENPKNAFDNLLLENSFVKNLGFEKIFCYELAEDFEKKRETFFIK